MENTHGFDFLALVPRVLALALAVATSIGLSLGTVTLLVA